MNDVIGMAFRGAGARPVFDFDTDMGASTCVACGECVQACPTGALMEGNLLDAKGTRTVQPDRSVDTLCPFCGVGCQTTVHVKGQEDRRRRRAQWPRQQQPALRQGPLRLRLHPSSRPADRAAGAARGRAQGRGHGSAPRGHDEGVPRGELGGSVDACRRWLAGDPRQARRRRHRRLRLGQGLQRGGLSLPEADPAGVWHQQRRSLHAAVPRLVGGGADGRAELGRGDGAVHGRQG